MPLEIWILAMGGEVAILPLVLWWARSRAQLNRGQMWALALGMSTWFSLALLASTLDVFRPAPDRIPVLGFVIFGLIAGGLFTLSRLGARVPTRALPSLMAIQTLRATGFSFVMVYLNGQLPGAFALPAGIGDLLIGVTAPIAALAMARRWQGWRKLAIAWNVLGIADLALAVTMGVFTSPGPQQLIQSSVPGVALTQLPLSMIPTFGVPVAIMAHVLCIAALHGMATEPAAQRVPAARERGGLLDLLRWGPPSTQ